MAKTAAEAGGSIKGKTSTEAVPEHAAYLGHWLNVLKQYQRAIFSPASHAQRPADYIKRTTSTG